MCDLYGSWDNLPGETHELIVQILNSEDLEALYKAYADEEALAKDVLVSFDEDYPNVLKEDNLNNILSHLLA